MSYHAAYEMELVFPNDTENKMEEVMKAINDIVKRETDNDELFCNDLVIDSLVDGKNILITAYGNDRYDDINLFVFINDMNELSKKYPLSSGKIVFVGENNEQWRVIYRDNKFVYQEGYIQYRDRDI